MKKTAISLLLAVAMVFSLVLVAAPVAQAAEHTAHCVCGGSCTVGGHTHDTNVTWTKWDKADEFPTETGNYYLDTNVTLAARLDIKGDVVVCLNGKTVTCTAGTSTLKLTADSKLTLTDCTGNGIVTTESAPGKSGGVIYNDAAATLNIYGGNVKAPNDAKSGGAIYWGGGVLNIYGGTITGGTVTDRGGALNIAGCAAGTVCNMYGGTVKAGENTNVNEANGGGAIRIGGNNGGDKVSTFNFYGGVVDGGKSAGYGGSIYIQQPNNVLNIVDGTVKNGEAATAGPDIYVTKGATVKVVKLNAGATVTKGTDDATIDVTGLDASLKAEQNEKVVTIAAKPAPTPTPTPTPNPSTGDSANLVVMGLGLVLGVAGMACLLPKKQNV